jgi:Tfp pilus assembly protein PilN
MPKNNTINLLPQEEFDTSVIGRVLTWAMGTFRIIVIVTEMIVMAAFLSRFWLDAQNSDLNDAIKVKSAQIAAQSEFEKQFRNVQTKLSIIKQISQGKKATAGVTQIASKIPSDINLSSISVSDKEALVKGTAGSEIGIGQLIANLKTVKEFSNVDLGQINSSELDPSQTIFTVKISF